MVTPSAPAILAALLFATTALTPGDVVGASRPHSSTFDESASPAPAAAPTTRHTMVRQRTAAGAVPEFKVESVAHFFKSAPRSKLLAPIFRGGVTRKAPRSVAAPVTGSTVPIPSAPTSPRIAVYSGLNQPGIAASDNADEVTPPDSTGAIGPADYVEIVNSEIAVYSRSTLARSSISTLHDFIGDTGDVPDPYCDVQVQWDPSANRWLFSFLYCNIASSSSQHLVFGWSKTSVPTNLASGWCAFTAATGPFLWDYDKLGHNSKYIIIGANLYDTSTSTLPFATAGIAWITKPANGVTTCPTLPVAQFSPGTAANPLLNADGTNAYTPVPVNTTSGSGDGYIVSAHDPSGSNGQTPGSRNKLAVWYIDSSGVLHGPSDITVASFTFPSAAPQLGGAYPIDTLDGRLTQAVGDPTTGIWTQHTVSGPGGRSVVDWYEITVTGSTASLAQQGIIASSTDYVFNGSISPRFDGLGAAVFYNRSSASIDPLIAAQDRFSSTPLGTMEPGELILADSAAADEDFSCDYYSGAPCRWGDYSGASPDPVQANLVWGTNQVITASTSAPAWATQNFAVLLLSPPTGITAWAGDQSAIVTWTPGTPVSATPITGYTINTYVGASMVKETVVPVESIALVDGLTNGVTYTFTVTADAAAGSSPESAHSNAVTPTHAAAAQAPPLPLPSRIAANQSTSVPAGGR